MTSIMAFVSTKPKRINTNQIFTSANLPLHCKLQVKCK